MSEAKHTPGPWDHRLDLDPPDSGIGSANGGCVAHIQHHANVNTVARTGEYFSHADARLIAAAPELLAMCRRMLAFGEIAVRAGLVGFSRADEDAIVANHSDLKPLREIIARAEGKVPS